MKIKLLFLISLALAVMILTSCNNSPNVPTVQPSDEPTEQATPKPTPTEPATPEPTLMELTPEVLFENFDMIKVYIEDDVFVGWIYWFSEGLAVINDRESEKSGYIDTSGKLVIPFKFDNAHAFRENGLACVFEGRFWDGEDAYYGFIDKAGEYVYPLALYDKIIDYCEGIEEQFPPGYQAPPKRPSTPVEWRCNDEWYWSLYDADGNVIVKDKYHCVFEEFDLSDLSWLFVYSDGVAIAASGVYAERLSDPDEYWLVDERGNEIKKLEYTGVSAFSNGLSCVYEHKQIGKCWGNWLGYIDTEGNEVIPCVLEYAYSFSDGYAAVKYQGEWYILKVRE